MSASVPPAGKRSLEEVAQSSAGGGVGRSIPGGGLGGVCEVPPFPGISAGSERRERDSGLSKDGFFFFLHTECTGMVPEFRSRVLLSPPEEMG